MVPEAVAARALAQAVVRVKARERVQDEVLGTDQAQALAKVPVAETVVAPARAVGIWRMP